MNEALATKIRDYLFSIADLTPVQHENESSMVMSSIQTIHGLRHVICNQKMSHKLLQMIVHNPHIGTRSVTRPINVHDVDMVLRTICDIPGKPDRRIINVILQGPQDETPHDYVIGINLKKKLFCIYEGHGEYCFKHITSLVIDNVECKRRIAHKEKSVLQMHFNQIVQGSCVTTAAVVIMIAAKFDVEYDMPFVAKILHGHLRANPGHLWVLLARVPQSQGANVITDQYERQQVIDDVASTLQKLKYLQVYREGKLPGFEIWETHRAKSNFKKKLTGYFAKLNTRLGRKFPSINNS
jgi:hypothetical protein